MTLLLDLVPSFASPDGGPKRLLIDGQWVPAKSGKSMPTVNPSTGEVITHVAEGDAVDVDLAVAAARRAFEGPWAKASPRERQNLLFRLADQIEEHGKELEMLDVVEMGCPVARGGGAAVAADVFRYFAGWATKIHGETTQNSVPGSFFTYTRKEPVGVCASIMPWNGPIGMMAWKIAPVLATGCTMVLKPAEEASLTVLRVGELLCQVGLPPGVVNIVTGLGETAGAALTAHPGVDKVSFTGSSFTGQAVVRAAAGNLKRVSLELGGKSPDVIFADADLDAAVVGAGMAVFDNTGQICCAGTRLFVERPIYDEFVSRVSDLADSLKVGNSLDPETQIGPLVSMQQLERVTGYLDAGKQEGARATAGGSRLVEGDLGKGYFVPPTVFADVSDDMKIAQEEIFGPVASVLPFDDMDDVVRRANQTQFGLGAGVWTRDVGKAHKVANSIRAGVVWVNTYNVYDPSMPFGGVKMSGWGNELSVHALDEYLDVKAIWINTD